MSKRLTNEQFINKAKEKHNGKYIYSKTNYVNTHTPIIITCPIHGDFQQIPNDHLQGKGCHKCAIEKRAEEQSSCTEEFIQKAKAKHNGKYIYSKTNYVNNHTKVCIICPIHGEFWQTPNKHLYGRGCPKCAIENSRKKQSFCAENFIKKAKAIHNSEYDYSKVIYENNRTKVCIICPKHGEFYQTPGAHLQGSGCPKCSIEKRSKDQSSTTEKFIKAAKEKYGEKYIYSKVKYINHHTKVCIICPKHGEFWQLPSAHLQWRGCPKCAKEKKAKELSLSTEEFIERSIKMHKDKYIYSKTYYTNNHTPVIITCPVHGDFKQIPSNHLRGCGCPQCKASHLEKETALLLQKYDIKYEAQKKFEWLKSMKGRRMSLDFFLSDYNIGIECQGIQHYESHGIYTKDMVNDTRQRDELKKQLCDEYNIRLFYIKYDDVIDEKIGQINKFISNLHINRMRRAYNMERK